MSDQDSIRILHQGRYLSDDEEVCDSFEDATITVELGEAPPQAVIDRAPWILDRHVEVDFGIFAHLPSLDHIDRKVLGLHQIPERDGNKLRFPLKLVDLPAPARLPSVAKKGMKRTVSANTDDQSSASYSKQRAQWVSRKIR